MRTFSDASIHLDRRDQLWPGHGAREALQRCTAQERALPPAQRARPACASSRSASTRTTGDEVPYEEIVKGYEIAPDQYVLIEPGELEALDPKKTKTIEIYDFVELDADRPDLLRPPVLPRARRRRRQALPAAATRRWPRAARSRSRKVVIRQKENLVAIRPMEGGVLGMSTMIFADEVVPPDRLDDLPDDDRDHASRRSRWRSMLIDSLAGDFEPEKYQRHLPRGGDRADRAQGRGQGDRGAAGGRGGGRAGARPDGRAEGVARRRPEGRRREEARRQEARRRRRRPPRRRPPQSAEPPPPVGNPRADGSATAPIGLLRPRHQAPRGAARGSSTCDADGERVTDAEVLAADQRARDPAGVGGRLDLPVPGRPHPGDRQSTTAGASSTSTTRAGASAATSRSSTTWSSSRARCRRCASASRRTSRGDELDRDHVLACAVRLLDRGFFRIGSEDYAVTNETYGLATMRKSHAAVKGDTLLFDYPAKSGKRRVQAVVDPEIADDDRRAQAPPRRRRRAAGLQALGRAGPTCARTTSTRTSRRPRACEISAKDFRTWGATVMAAIALAVAGAGGRHEDRAQAGDHAGGQGGRLLPRQHAGGRARVLHRPARVRPLPRRRRRSRCHDLESRRRRHGDPGRGRGGRARPDHRQRAIARRPAWTGCDARRAGAA